CCVKDIWNNYIIGCGLNTIAIQNLYLDATGLYKIYECTNNPIVIVKQPSFSFFNLLFNVTAVNSNSIIDNSYYQNTLVISATGIGPVYDSHRGWVIQNPSQSSY